MSERDIEARIERLESQVEALREIAKETCTWMQSAEPGIKAAAEFLKRLEAVRRIGELDRGMERVSEKIRKKNDP